MNIFGKLGNYIGKIDEYVSDKNASGEILPYGKWGMRLDAILNYILYGTSFSEYFAYRFYALNRKEKNTFMTRRYMFNFFDKYNPVEFRSRIGDKRLTKDYYGSYLKRHQFQYEDGIEKFCEFCISYPHLFIKKAISWGGVNAFPFDIHNDNEAKELYEKLDSDVVIEERIVNHKLIRELHPKSLNTIKILTLYLQDHAEIQTALFRMGNNTIVDNVHSGGMCALIDIDSGIVCTKAIDKHWREYVFHPITHKKIVGFEMPMWEDAKKMALDAATITPEMKYSSWDIAITENGPILIEGNWDAEFYAEQMIMQKGTRLRYCNKLNGK